MPLFLKSGPRKQLSFCSWTGQVQTRSEGKSISGPHSTENSLIFPREYRKGRNTWPTAHSSISFCNWTSQYLLPGISRGCLGKKSKQWHIWKEPSLARSSQQMWTSISQPPVPTTPLKVHLKGHQDLSCSCFKNLKPLLDHFQAAASGTYQRPTIHMIKTNPNMGLETLTSFLRETEK